MLHRSVRHHGIASPHARGGNRSLSPLLTGAAQSLGVAILWTPQRLVGDLRMPRGSHKLWPNLQVLLRIQAA